MTLCGRGFSRRCFKEASTSALHNQAFRQIASRFLLTCSYEAMSLSQWVSIIYGLTLLPPLPPFFCHTHTHSGVSAILLHVHVFSFSASRAIEPRSHQWWIRMCRSEIEHWWAISHGGQYVEMKKLLERRCFPMVELQMNLQCQDQVFQRQDDVPCSVSS